MDEPLLKFENVSFFYPRIEEPENAASVAAIAQPAEVTSVFSHLTVSVPDGVVSLVGQNGIGKTTFLLLAGARVFPAEGRVELAGHDTAEFKDARESDRAEQTRNRLVSFVYQNMEFETEESIGELMGYIFETGIRKTADAALVEDLRKVLELDAFLNKKLQVLSKGQMQRAIIAFSLLYGSRVIMMDEPVFALEEPQKERVFEYLMDYSSRYGTAIYYSAHNLELTRRYSRHMVLFRKGGSVLAGRTEELFSRDTLEAAYQVPMDALYRRDSLYREMLTSLSRRPK